jgi:hypothetical protein
MVLVGEVEVKAQVQVLVQVQERGESRNLDEQWWLWMDVEIAKEEPVRTGADSKVATVGRGSKLREFLRWLGCTPQQEIGLP